MSRALSTGTAFLYGRSEATSASKMSEIVIIRDWRGISARFELARVAGAVELLVVGVGDLGHAPQLAGPGELVRNL